MPKSTTERPVLYPHISVAVCGDPAKTGITPDGASNVAIALAAAGLEGLISFSPPMSHIDARALMGWTVEEEGGEKFGDDYLCLDHYGRKVRADKNPRNRPYYDSNAEDRAQDILNKRWELNGETLIVSQEGDVLDGQHTAGGLIRAYERWLLDKDPQTGKRLWLELWPEDKYPNGPVIDKIIVYGISSADHVVNTMNTGKPRTLADVLYRSPYFVSLPTKNVKTGVDRVSAAKVTSSAISHVWARTGMYLSNFGSRRTTAEACAWLEAHGGTKGKFLATVRHILEQDKDGRVSDLVPLGYAVCIMWLMASSATSEQKTENYYADDERKVKGLDFSLWTRAVEFWTEFGKCKEAKDEDTLPEPAGELKELTSAIRAINDSDSENSNSNLERNYVINRAWARWRESKKVRPEDCEVKYHRADRHGVRRLDFNEERVSARLLGGIDLGLEKIARPEPVSTEHEGTYTPDPNVPVENAAVNGVESLIAAVRNAENVENVLLRTPSGGYAVWGQEQCESVASYVTKKPRMHPKGLVQIALRADEAARLAELLTDNGGSVAFVVENVAATNGDPKYTVEHVVRAKKTKVGE